MKNLLLLICFLSITALAFTQNFTHLYDEPLGTFGVIDASADGILTTSRSRLMLLTQEGLPIWDKELNDRPVRGTVKADNGDYIVIKDILSSPSSNSTAISLIRIDKNGNTIWSKYLDSGTRNSNPKLIKSINDSYIVGSWTDPFVDNVWLCRIDGNGNVIWSKRYDYGGDDQFYDISPASDGNGGCVFTGAKINSKVDIFLTEVDVNGNISNSFLYGSNLGPKPEIDPRRLKIDNQGNRYIVGWRSEDQSDPRDHKLVLMKTNGTTGAVEFETELLISQYRSFPLFRLALDNAGNSYVSVFVENSGYRIFKFDNSGNIQNTFIGDHSSIARIHSFDGELYATATEFQNPDFPSFENFLSRTDQNLTSCGLVEIPSPTFTSSILTVTPSNPTVTTQTYFTGNYALNPSDFNIQDQKYCPAGPYVVANDSTYCNELVYCGQEPKVCIPLEAIDNVDAGIIGMDFCLDYDETLMTPTGVVTLGNVVLDGSTEADYYINYITDPGKVHVSIYYTSQAPNGAEFEGLGDIACVEFLLNSNFVAGTTAAINACGITESYELSVYQTLASDGSFTLLNDDLLDGQLIYWDDENRPLRYDNSNPADYNVTKIFGVDSGCNNSSASTNPDLDGRFQHDINDGLFLTLNRDIEGDNLGGFCPTDVMPFINGMDCYWISLVSTQNSSYVPSPFQMIAMDVNMDDNVSAGDITQIQNRIIQNICEFPQAWNYPAPTELSKDWRFIDKHTVENAPDFVVSNVYPNSDGSGYERTNVPDVPDCIEVLVSDLYGYCSYIDSMTYHGILLGDSNGSWDGNSTPVALKTNNSDKTIIDLNAATSNDDCTVKIPLRYESNDAFRALDFKMDYDEAKLEFLGVEYASINSQQAGMAWNDQNGQRLIFTSYAKQLGGITTSAPLFNLVFRLKNNNISENDLGELTSYFNSTANEEVINNGQTNCTTVGINEPDFGEGIYIYPSHFTDVLTINLLDYRLNVEEITLFDVTGRIISEKEGNQGEIVKLDLGHLPAGIYLLRINDKTRKVIKK